MYYLALNNHQELGKFQYLEIPSIKEAHIYKNWENNIIQKKQLTKVRREYEISHDFKPQTYA